MNFYKQIQILKKDNAQLRACLRIMATDDNRMCSLLNATMRKWNIPWDNKSDTYARSIDIFLTKQKEDA